jgi:8-oxo-dGTP pyrophosphatase MutT (NUDIX family)/broad specificity phosphatase PhoE
MVEMRLIRSAGGVVWRAAPVPGRLASVRADGASGPGGASLSGTHAGAVEVAVIHRNRYDDWSLPKGKLERGEHELAAAVREIREETGVTAIPQIRLPSTRYLTGEPDTEKSVEFWSMQELSPSTFVTSDEVDELRWLAPHDATGLLTYAHDRGVVAAFAELAPVTGIAVVVRHADAGSRAEWAADPNTGHDDDRPLDEVGHKQVSALTPLLSLFKPARVYSAPLVRCVDTVAPMGLPVRTDPVFAEETAATPAAVAGRLRALVAESGRIVVASQGGVIPDLVAELHPANAIASQTYKTPKGSGWVLAFSGDGLTAADPLVP